MGLSRLSPSLSAVSVPACGAALLEVRLAESPPAGQPSRGTLPSPGGGGSGDGVDGDRAIPGGLPTAPAGASVSPDGASISPDGASVSPGTGDTFFGDGDRVPEHVQQTPASLTGDADLLPPASARGASADNTTLPLPDSTAAADSEGAEL